MATPVTQGGIARNDSLIPNMVEDHRCLLDLFGEIQQCAVTAQWRAVEYQLAEFRAMLTDHLLLESVKLYAFLKQQYGHDDETLANIQDFAGEMNIIRKHVTTTLAYYLDVNADSRKQDSFPAAWAAIGKALGARIAREEKSLYPLY
jgi:hypothetical protein